jgi:hypothetical protein
MKLSSPDIQVFLHKLKERGVVKVQEDLLHGRYGPPYEELARKWLGQMEKSNANQFNKRGLRLTRWQIILAIIAILVTILVYLLSRNSGR